MNMKRNPAITFLLLVACASGANPHGAEGEAIQIAERFYRWAVEAGAQPDPAPVRDLLGRELFDLLLAQAAYERACAAAAPPDEKPHMLDQNPFFLWPEGAREFSVGRGERSGGRVRVAVTLRYEELEWVDVAVLARERQRWVLHDLEWEQGGLRERLADFLTVPCAPGEGDSR